MWPASNAATQWAGRDIESALVAAPGGGGAKTVNHANEAIVHEVFRRVRAGDSGVADLYAEDATLVERGNTHIGRDAIRAFYARVIEEFGTQPVVCGVWNDGSNYAAVVEATRRDGSVAHAVDVFTVTGGAVRFMTIHMGQFAQEWQLTKREGDTAVG